jgi:glyoxylase-like metal-dependent hydrolase (beta-lactamase superfamily II)
MKQASTAESWFQVTAPIEGVYAIREPHHSESVLSYLVLGEERAVLIDTGMGVGDIREVVESLAPLPIAVVNSHAHWDHIGGNWQFTDISIHAAEAGRLPEGVSQEKLAGALSDDELSGPLPEGFDRDRFAIRPSTALTLLHGGEVIELGGRALEIIHAPGHSPDGIVVLDRARGVLFSTDVAYPGSLYAFGPDTDLDDYQETLAQLARLVPDLTSVHPSHNSDVMDPSLLTAMSFSMSSVCQGRDPDEQTDRYDRHQFEGFAILVAPSSRDDRAQ